MDNDNKNFGSNGAQRAGNIGGYYRSKYKKQFTPKKPVRSFRDLDVYQKTLTCAVIVAKDLRPKLVTSRYMYADNVMACAMDIPLCIAEAHSIRFADFPRGLGFMERALSSCNKMAVYLEHAKGIYGSKVDTGLVDDLIGRYADSRTKAFRLETAWKRWQDSGVPRPRQDPPVTL